MAYIAPTPVDISNMGYVLTSNGSGQLPSFQLSAGVVTINTDNSGSVSGGNLNLYAQTIGTNCGGTVLFSSVSATEINLLVTDISGNTTLGENSGNTGLTTNLCTYNTLIGASAGSLLGTTSSACTGNTAVGYGSFLSNLSSNYCTSIGYDALTASTIGDYNVAVGANALKYATIGAYNIAVGNDTLDVTSGSYNIALGYVSGQAYGAAESANICIGNQGVTGESHVIRIGTQGSTGSLQDTCYIAGIFGSTVTGAAVICNSNGMLGTVVSSQRYKENIADMGDASSCIYDLRPRTFNYTSEKNKDLHFGMIAEEVLPIMPNLVLYSKDGQPDALKYHELPAILLNELQKLEKRVASLESQINQK